MAERKCDLKTSFQMLPQERASPEENVSFSPGKGVAGPSPFVGRSPRPIWMGEVEINGSKGNRINEVLGLSHFLLETQEKAFGSWN